MQLHTKNSEDLTAREIFQITIEFMQGAYPNRNIRFNGGIVEIDGEPQFNIEGYNLLFNLKRLCMFLEDELK